jgi:3',5'-cyclic AMP phosphodiesterase CpdA
MRIAHVSDVHILDRRPSGQRSRYDLGVRFLSFGRPLDAHARARKLTSALKAAERGGADHVVVSGDLTESGVPAQFEELAGVLHETRIDPERITLVPGNHDAYGEPREWERALDGPLKAFARSSAGVAGKVVERGELYLLPIDVAFPQPITRSAGLLTSEAAEAVKRRACDRAMQRRAVVVVQHHPPFAHARAAWQWIDGLQGHERMTTLLASAPSVHVLHGHLHKSTTHARVFGAPAVVDDPDDRPRVRLYDLRDGALESVGMTA